MASDEKKFSHITVTSDDDDVVIQAGVRSSDTAPDDEVVVDEVVEPQADNEAVPESSSTSRGDADETDRGDVAASDTSYRETTAEDLEVEPMSLMQKVIIGVALVAIVAFVAYYVFLR